MEPVYVTPEMIERALDVKPSAYMRSEILRACRAGSRMVEGRLHRIFYPERIARTFDYPVPGGGKVNKLWFDELSLISMESVVSDGVTIPVLSVFARPDDGPPFSWVELDRDTVYSFAGGPQRAVTITGVWGYTNEENANGTLSSSINSSDTALTLSRSLDTGSIIRIGSERIQVIAKRWALAGQTTPAVSADKTAVAISLGSVAVFVEGEKILIDGERMEVQEITGNTLYVRRAIDGTILAAHSNGTQIYRQTLHDVERGALGTTAAAHDAGDTVYQWQCPSLVAELAQAYAEDAFIQRNAGYARTIGSGEGERQASGRGIRDVEDRAYQLYGRKARLRSV